MTGGKGRNTAASVKQRLLNLAHERGMELQYLLTRYAIERLLYRLGRSPHGSRFLVKGATLYSLWAATPQRPTWDVDLLGRGASDAESLETVFRDLCELGADVDGLVFLGDRITTETIRREEEYQGVRVRLEARLGTARIQVQIDIGFGDVVTPAAVEVDFPVLLDHPSPRLAAYPRETVVAEKFEAMVSLDLGNSRMKDFYDVWALARHFEFDGGLLAQAVSATFQRRGTPLPDSPPTGLSKQFTEHVDKLRQWTAFLKRVRLQETPILAEVVQDLNHFLMPVVEIARGQREPGRWQPGGPWEA